MLMLQLLVRNQAGELLERISPWSKYVVKPDSETVHTFDSRFWMPPDDEVPIDDIHLPPVAVVTSMTSLSYL